jgi:sortase A
MQRTAFAAVLLAAVTCLATGFWIPIKAEIAQILLERAWHAVRTGNDDARPWPWADTSPMAKLSIPKLHVAWIVLSGASGRNLAFAPAHLDGSAAPGEPGVTIIAGHRDTHFEALETLEAGTDIVVENAAGQVFTYRVTGVEIIDSTRASLRLDADSPTLVLATCYPFDAVTAGGPLRFIVEAEALVEA